MNKLDKLPMHTPNLADKNFEALAAMFPNAVTETIDENGTVIRSIDADVLAQEINTHVVSGREERYQFTWPDKRKSILLANAPIAATFRPCREESVDFDNTENLYIEGDNLDVLKLLRETYLNRVKMIYIDPPYNTGNDFLYEDDFSEDTENFLRRDGYYDEEENRLQTNRDSKEISKKHAVHIKLRKNVRLKKGYEEVRKAVMHAQSAGVFPSRSTVEQLLPSPEILRERPFYELWKELINNIYS